MSVKYLAYSALLCLLLSACDEIFVKDISEEQVALVVPADGLESSASQITFIWEELEGASHYHLQIASPSFENIQSLVMDCVLTTTSFPVDLSPGSYEWKLNAMNNAYSTDYASRSLSVDSTYDISASQLIQIAPDDSLYSSLTTLQFSWEALSGANQYSLLIYEGPSADNELYTSEITTSSTSVTPSVSFEEGWYAWQVRGENERFNSAYKEASFLVDTTSPGSPQNVLPSGGFVSPSDTVNISWTFPQDVGSPLSCSYAVYLDQNRSTLFDSGSSGSGNIRLVLSTGTYYYELQLIDAAGNIGPLTNLVSFTVL